MADGCDIVKDTKDVEQSHGTIVRNQLDGHHINHEKILSSENLNTLSTPKEETSEKVENSSTSDAMLGEVDKLAECVARLDYDTNTVQTAPTITCSVPEEDVDAYTKETKVLAETNEAETMNKSESVNNLSATGDVANMSSAVNDVVQPRRIDAPEYHSRTSSESDLFKIRTITFDNCRRRIVMQSRNGPCPLIAAVNALLLKGVVSLPLKDQSTITRANILEVIAGKLMQEPDKLSDELRSNYEKSIADVLDMLPDVVNGLEVNLGFDHVTSFEYTTAIAMFDLLSLNLYHTWVVEEGSESESYVKPHRFNELNVLATDPSDKGLLLKSFLNETETQMTYTGLAQLRDTIKHGEIAVLFRNNHFHTIHKREDELFLLCSDEGFMDSPDAVWETVRGILGESIFVNDIFGQPAQNTEPIEVHDVARTPSDNSGGITPTSSYEYSVPNSQHNAPKRSEQRTQQFNKKKESSCSIC